MDHDRSIDPIRTGICYGFLLYSNTIPICSYSISYYSYCYVTLLIAVITKRTQFPGKRFHLPTRRPTARSYIPCSSHMGAQLQSVRGIFCCSQDMIAISLQIIIGRSDKLNRYPYGPRFTRRTFHKSCFYSHNT